MTERLIKTLDAPPHGNVVFYDRSEDTPRGFGLRVTAAGVKAFVLNYRVDGRERRLTIGRWPVWSASAARERAKELRRAIDRGEDPLADKQARRGAPTVAYVAEEYLSRYAVNKKSVKADTWYLRKEVIPEWGSRKAVDITRADVIALVEGKAKTAPIAGNMLLSIIKGTFNWAVSVDLLQTNPATTVRPPARKVARDRFLSEAEIRIGWSKLESAAMSPECRAALRLILCTGCRPGEACGLRWDELQGDLWTLPASRAKQARQHVIPLSTLAVEILASMPRTSEYVFPSPARKGRHVSRIGLSQAVLLNRKHFGLERFTPHDLRRSCITHLPAPRFIKERIAGHADKGVTGIYDQYEYLSEKRAALEAWAAKLRDITK